MFWLWTWLIGIPIMAVIYILGAVILTEDGVDSKDLEAIAGVGFTASVLWFLAIPVGAVAVIGLKLRKRYQKPLSKWLDNLFEDKDED